jgi:D-arabinose 1-dehydrogenase-like Zn-dependent alcohol dehydrogenase
MLAARFKGVGQPLTVEEVPVPQPGPLEVLVKVDACGICLSDVHLIDGGIPAVIPEVTPGHEASGTVVATGDLATGWKPGRRATLAGGRPCGQCAMCTTGRIDQCNAFQIMGFHYDGAWAEYVVVPFFTLAPLPDRIPAEHAAILADAVATPYAALSERAALRPGEAVGLWGIGGLGTHAVQIARLLGAGTIIAVDPLASARDRALKLGADVAIDPTTQDVETEVRKATGGAGLDVAVDLIGKNSVLKEGLSCLAPRGRLVMVGLSIEPLEFGPGILLGVQRQSILGHLGYEKRHLDDLITLLANDRLDLSASISDVIPLTDVADGVRRLAEKEGDPVRIVVRP